MSRAGARPRSAFVVSHTHWDREWYQTLSEFRVDMVRAFREVLDALEDGTLDHFLLDGQAILLEDYLAVRPGDRDRIARLVADRKLAVGPWYVLPDEFLVSGEATVRNLLYGHLTARRFGGVQKIGYMPDSFGHIAQMPQLLRGAGIDSFVYTRGNGDEIDRIGYEFDWRAPDGSEVLALNQVRGYCNAGGLGLREVWHAHTPREVEPERAVAQVREIFEAHAAYARCDVVLLSNGCDHFPLPRDLDRVLAALREAFPDTEFRPGDLADYVDAIRERCPERETYEGELRGGRLHHILSGVWSTRMYLKQANEEAQVWLAEVVEPLAAAARFLHGREYPSGLIDACWKELLENHPHDSICGCSTDEVHREMETRFDSVQRACEQIVRRILKDLTPTFGPRPEDDRETVFCVANPLPFARTEVVRRLVVLQPPAADESRLALFDEDGRRLPCRISKVRRVERFWGVDYRVGLDGGRQENRFEVYEDAFGPRILRPETERDSADTFLWLEFVAELPSLGHVRLELRQDDGPIGTSGADAVGKHRWPPPVRVTGDAMDNGLCHVRLHPDGRLDLEDRVSGRSFPSLHVLEDSEDVGDEYDFSPAARGEIIRSEGLSGKVTCVREGGWSAVLGTRFELELPASATADRQGRSADRVACPVEVRVELRSGSPLVRIETRVDNRAADHRLRATFRTGIRTGHAGSDGHFQVHRRELPDPEAGSDWVQPPSGTFPQQEYTLVEDGEGGLVLLNRGLPEIEATGRNGGEVELALTLFRSVGWLSRDDFVSRRRSNAGPTLHTPGAQCRREMTFRYALMPFGGSTHAAGVRQWSRRYRVEPVAVQGVLAGGIRGGRSLLRQERRTAAITAIKRHASRDTLVVRLFNPSSKAVTEVLSTDAVIEGAWMTDLLEERIGELAARRGSVEIDLDPHRIATVELNLA